MSALLPLVTVVMPARNEARDIERALAAVVAQDYPHDRMQVLVVDGSSTDETATTAERALQGAGFGDARVLVNADGSTPSNLNRGLNEAKGEYLCRVDARSIIPTGYVRRCIDVLADDVLAVVGGRQVAVASEPGTVSAGIARALNNRWTMGLSRYRRGGTSGPSDTVYLGAFRTHQLRTVGGWDERLTTNQDFDLNVRMSTLGTVWFDASLRVEYVARRHLHALWTQYTRFGRGKVLYWNLTGTRPQPRQWLGLIGPWLSALLVCAWVIRAPGRVRRIGGTAFVAAGGVALLDHLGSEPDNAAPLTVRATSSAAIGTIVGGWVWGATRTAIAARRR